MGSEETKLDLETVRLFKRDVQEQLERQTRGRQQAEKRGVAATPRATGSNGIGMGNGAGMDVFGMYVPLFYRVAFEEDGDKLREVC
jgi:DNA polymerase alpha subunit B